MKPYTPSQIAALEARSVVRRNLFVFALPSGTYGFWQGRGPLPWNTVVFKGALNLIEAVVDAQKVGSEANGMDLKLYENPAVGLTASVLSTIFAESYRGKPVALYEAIIDPESRTIVDDPSVVFSGYILKVMEKTSGGRFYIEGRCESRKYDNTDRGWEKANSAHHARVSPGDLFFDHGATAGRVGLYFGGPVPPNSAPSTVLM